ncbi:MAG: hypothetical protein JXR69_05785 [Candidatus Delongbacteria bacterium]|nr:hypothetical protein [Candidatus Delongbacteria bacterium]
MFKEFFKNWNASNLLTQSVNDSHEMFKIALKMYKITIESIAKKDIDYEELGENIKKDDYLLNHYDKSIRKKIFEHISLNEKEDQELYTSMILFSLVGDIERIGDYIKNIYEIISKAKLLDDNMNSEVQQMFKNIDNLFEKTIKAYQSSDLQTAKEINDDYFKYKKKIDTLVDILINDENITGAAGYALLFRYLKRIGAHLMHISSSISNPIDKIGYYID